MTLAKSENGNILEVIWNRLLVNLTLGGWQFESDFWLRRVNGNGNYLEIFTKVRKTKSKTLSDLRCSNGERRTSYFRNRCRSDVPWISGKNGGRFSFITCVVEGTNEAIKDTERDTAEGIWNHERDVQ